MLELQDVVRHSGLLDRRDREQLLGVRGGQRRHAVDPVGHEAGDRPGEYRPPVVPDDTEAFDSERVDDPDHVAHQRLVVVAFRAIGPIRLATAPLVRSDDAIARIGEGRNLVAPHVCSVRKPMKENHGLALAFLDHAEVQAIRSDRPRGGFHPATLSGPRTLPVLECRRKGENYPASVGSASRSCAA